MRDKINGNPVVQAAIVGVLVLVAGFLLLTRVMGGGSSEEPVADPAGTVSPAPVDDASAAAVPSTDATGTAAAVPAAGVVVAAPAGEFVAGPGLPKDVVKAYDGGKTIVLLVIRENPQGCFAKGDGTSCAGIDDRELNRIVREVGQRPNTTLFVTHAAGLWRYSRIAEGADVQRTPALVVLQPRRLADGGPPVATLSYGFRGPKSVIQTVDDAEYKGRADIPYYPE